MIYSFLFGMAFYAQRKAWVSKGDTKVRRIKKPLSMPESFLL